MFVPVVSRPCPLCGATESAELFAAENCDPALWDSYAFASRKPPEYMHYRLLLCADCQLVYASPAPTLDALGVAYRSAAYGSGAEAEYAARTYARLVRRLAARLPDRNGVLDVGAGDGALLGQLLALGFTNVGGVEPSAAPLDAAAESVRPLIRQMLFRGRDYPPESLSLVTCLQTIEHLHDPLQTCRDAYALLKPGGVLMLVLHNRRALSARLLGLRSPIYDIEHLQLFCCRSVRLLLQRAGFQEVDVHGIWNRYPFRYWLQLCPFPPAFKRWLATVTKATRLDTVSVALPAGNLVAVGSKPSPGVRSDRAPTRETEA